MFTHAACFRAESHQAPLFNVDIPENRHRQVVRTIVFFYIVVLYTHLVARRLAQRDRAHIHHDADVRYWQLYELYAKITLLSFA